MCRGDEVAVCVRLYMDVWECVMCCGEGRLRGHLLGPPSGDLHGGKAGPKE